MGILLNELRNGNFNSSEIVALMSVGSRQMTDAELAAYKLENPKGKKTTISDGLGKAAFTFIHECNMERRLGRSLTDESNARPLSWGKLLEPRANNHLGLEYELCSQVTLVHREIPYWVGSPDGRKHKGGKTVVEFKCPMTLKSFCLLVDPLYEGLTGMDAMNAIRNGWTNKAGLEVPAHSDGEKYYWQIVSNACHEDAPYGELIVHMPYYSEIQDIRRDAQESGESAYYWINYANDDELPHLIDGGYYSNINIIRFEIPQADKDLLKSNVLLAGKHLITSPSPTLIATPIEGAVLIEQA